MSVTVRKKRIYADSTAGRYDVMYQLLQEILVYGRSISGVKTKSVPGEGYYIYSSINLSGGSLEELIFNWYSGSFLKFGACRDGHEDYTDPDTYAEAVSNNDYDIFLYLYEKDGQLIGLNMVHNGSPARDSGHFVFYYDDDGLKVCFQGYYGDYVSPTYGDLRVNDGTSQGGYGTIILAGEYEFAGNFAPNVVSNTVAGGNIKTAAGYVLMYPVMQNDAQNRANIQREYPVSILCSDLAIYGYRGTRATYRRISVDGKNYIHIGGALWIEYDNFVESTIHV